MQWLNKLFISLLENRSNKGWKQNRFPTDIFPPNQIESYKETVKKTTFWHGTGRVHFRVQGESKYNAQVSGLQEDILEKILCEGGVKPSPDIFVKNQFSYGTSISTTRWRAYARLYAEINFTVQEKLQLYYGSRADIIRFFIAYSFSNAPLRHIITALKRGYAYKETKLAGESWVAPINNNIKSKGNSFSDLTSVLGEGFSNCPGNYPLLLGLAPSQKEIFISPIINLFESRFAEVLPVSEITHIEVPLDHLVETKQFLEAKKSHIPIFPIELGEFLTAQNHSFQLHSKWDASPPYVRSSDIALWEQRKLPT